MSPELNSFGENAHYSAKNTEENKGLNIRARENGEFTVLDVAGTKDQLFVPNGADHHAVTIDYMMVNNESKSIVANVSYRPGMTENLETNKSRNKNILSKIIGKIGIKGVNK